MLVIQKSTVSQLLLLLDDQCSKIDEFFIHKNEEVAPHFLLEFAIDKLNKDSHNSFWWSPRLIIVDNLIVGMGGFKSPPSIDGSVEIGYGIIPSQRSCGFATQAVGLLLTEGSSTTEVQKIVAHTSPLNKASWRVLEKNGFVRAGSKIDPDDGELWVWQRSVNLSDKYKK